MEIFSGILANQAPPKQTAATTIATLCDRLQQATLLEDRRAAVLGLRSFARDHKESVASGGLRGLISTLAKDNEDVDTVKVVLETLLLLFVKEDDNPDSPDDIALWLADEFTQKQDNITLLIDLLEKPDFYERLYSLKILIAILKHRPDRARECIFSAPLGISRLVATLDDRREIIRNEGVLLLIALTEDHGDIQKLVAFENAFDRLFNIINLEAGLEGGVLVYDCLRLFTNLLAFNMSNQSFFRETGCVPKLVKLFSSISDDSEPPPDSSLQNVLALLNLCKIFVTIGGGGTHPNQIAFWQSSLTMKVINLAFGPKFSIDIRSEALATVGDMIRGNHALQESFAPVQVDASTLPSRNIESAEQTTYVIEALLDMALLDVSVGSFSLRMAAVKTIEGYVHNNTEIRLHFLDRAVKGFTSGEDETANIFNALMELDSDSRADPYRTWFSGVIFMNLIYDSRDAQDVAMLLSSGDAESGEEVVTAIQTLSSNLVSSLQYDLNIRISIAYLMPLCVWLFDNTDAVNDFLNEASTIESLLAIINQANKVDPILQGLCTFLLGLLYEFSSKSSPISRATLHSLILGRLSKDQYFHKLNRLRQHPAVRDFEVLNDQAAQKKAMPEIYFTADFIDFFKDHYSRVARSLDKDPGDGFSGKHVNGTSNAVSTEMLESVKLQLEVKEDELSKSQASFLTLEHKYLQEQEEFRRYKESSGSTLQRIKEVAAREIALSRDESQNLREQFEEDISTERDVHKTEMEKMVLHMESLVKDTEAAEHTSREAAGTVIKLQRDVAELEIQIGTLRTERSSQETQIAELRSLVMTLETQLTQEMEDAKTRDVRYAVIGEREKAEVEERIARIMKESGDCLKDAEAKAEQERMALEIEKQEQKDKTDILQGEMDDLMLVMADLEENVKNYKKKLKDLGQDISEDEVDENDEDEEEGEID